MEKKTLLANNDLRHEYGLGRDLSTQLARLLPHVKTGRAGRGDKLLIRRVDIERLIGRAMEERRDLWEISRSFTPQALAEWLEGERLN